MPISLACPGCGTRLNLADALAGKTIKCFHCNGAVTVPADDYEVVGGAPPVKAKPGRPVADQPRKKPTQVVEEDDDEDYDVRPRRKGAGIKNGVPVWVYAAAGGGLLLILGVVAFLVFGTGVGSKIPGAGGLVGRSAPPGYTAVRDADGGYAVFLPGQVQKAEHRSDKPLPPGYELSVYGGTDGNWTVFARSMKPGNDFNPGTSPDQLYGLLKKHGGGIEAPWNEVTAKTPITLNGKPGLEVKIREKKDWMGDTVPEPQADDDPRLPAEIREHRKQVADSLKKSREAERNMPGRREVYYVTTDGKRVIILHLSGKGDFPAEEMLKTIKDSFEFL